MKRFKFRLQRVLDYRNTLKREKERELALRNRELFSAQNRLQEINNEIDSLPTPSEEVMTMAELALGGQYRRYLRDALVGQRVVVLEAAEAVDKARDAYVEKAVESKSLDTLKERRIEEYKTERRRQERKDIDELTVQRQRFKGGD